MALVSGSDGAAVDRCAGDDTVAAQPSFEWAVGVAGGRAVGLQISRTQFAPQPSRLRRFFSWTTRLPSSQQRMCVQDGDPYSSASDTV